MDEKNFIFDIIEKDLEEGKNGGKVLTRFPPEPNGYLHIGHAKSICLNFGIAKFYGGLCNLRFDDTNPVTEDKRYMDAIMEAIRWLGFDWQDRLFHASDYFDQLFEFASLLIRRGKAYVCDLTTEQIREYRGTLTTAGKESPFRDRSIEENLELFYRMRRGKFPDESRVLRAKIAMDSTNINMRDPVIYRIRHERHPKTGDKWPIYPMYDYAHCVSDALEGITHSLCTLEFENHRMLYDWFLDQLPELPHPRQIEFARLNLSYTVMSKRRLLELVEGKLVNGWDDPRLSTLAGIRRRGFTSDAIRNFCKKIGVTKQESTIEMGYFEECLRENLNTEAPRVMAVLRPIKLVINNFAENQVEYLDAPWHPQNLALGSRKLAFTRELYIEREDFMENPSKDFFRLAPGKEVRLRYAYIICCENLVKDEMGNITEIHCLYDPTTRGGHSAERKVKGTIHWVSASKFMTAEIRLYDSLFTVSNPSLDKDRDFKDYLNPNSLTMLKNSVVEEFLVTLKPEDKFQFERLGYFCVDKDSRADRLVFNRIVTLKDSWLKIARK